MFPSKFALVCMVASYRGGMALQETLSYPLTTHTHTHTHTHTTHTAGDAEVDG